MKPWAIGFFALGEQLRAIWRKYEPKRSRDFNLQAFFASLSFLCIGAISGGSVFILYQFMANEFIERDATTTMEFVRSIARINPGDPGGLDLQRDREQISEFFAHIVTMPDVVQANVYDPQWTIIWSSAPQLIGAQFNEGNDELRDALNGRLSFELGNARKEEHAFLPAGMSEFVEYYIPIWNAAQTEVAFVAEVYKAPGALLDSIRAGLWFLWISAVVGGLVLYAILLWIVHRASLVMQAQQQRLIESETMAAIGDMASAVAHGIRNPLASIRSSAELSLEDPLPDTSREATRDIIVEVDRIDEVIRELILIARHDVEQLEEICLSDLIQICVDEFSPEMERQSVELMLEIEEPLAPIRGDRALLRQALGNVIANALDAMPRGGRLVIGARNANGSKRIAVTVADSGRGIAKDRLSQVFKPFVTSKRAGLGIGLALVKRIVERHGGSVALASEEGRGTTVTFRLPVEAA